MEIKKNPKADLNDGSGLFLNIGLCISLLLVILAFEWKSYDDKTLLDLGTIDDDFEDIIEIPPTEQPPPPPPKIKLPEIVEVEDEEEIEEDIEVDLDVEVVEETVVEEIILTEEEPAEKVEEIFTIVEDPAGYPGGLSEFRRFLATNLKYPRQAQRMGIEGKVYVQFVVEKNGSLTDIVVVKGIGAGCDEAAIAVLKKSKKWKPGKQRGKPVRQKMVQPIQFKLTH